MRRLLGLALGLAVIALVPAGATPPVVVPRLDAHADPLPPGALLRLGTTRLRHGETVTHLAFAASDRELLTLTLHSGHLRRWNVQTGGSLGPVRTGGRQPGLTDALFAADGRWLVMFGSQPFVLVDTGTGQAVGMPGYPCATAAFTTDGGALVTASTDGVVRRHVLPSGDLLADRALNLPQWARPVKGEPPAPHGSGPAPAPSAARPPFVWLALSPDGRLLAGVLKDEPADAKAGSVVRFWDSATGEQCRPPLSAGVRINGLAWSPDGTLVAALTGANTVTIWDPASASTVARFDHAPPAPAGSSSYQNDLIAFHPKGRALAWVRSGPSANVALWDVSGGKQLWRLPLEGRRHDVRSLDFSANGQRLALGEYNGMVTVVDTASGAVAAPAGGSAGDFRDAPTFMPDGQSLLAFDGVSLGLYELANGRRQRTFAGRRVSGLSRTGRYVAVGQQGDGLAVYETGTGRRLWQVPTHAAGALFAPDEVAVALHESNGTVTIRDTQTGREVVRFDGSPRQADFERCHTVSADFRWVATLDGEGRLTVRELATGKKHAESLLQGNKIRYAELQFGMDSKTLLARIYEPAVSSEYTQPVLTSVAVWDALTGRLLCRLAAQWEGAMLAPDGRQLLLSGRNVRKEPAMILDTRSGKALWAVPDLAFSGSRTAFSPDGQWLAFTDPQRKTLQLCEVLTGQVVRTFPSLPHRIRSVVFAPDGRSIATTGEDCALLVWDVTGLAPQAGRLRSSELDDEAREQLWSDLAATDGPPSNTAFWKLVAGGKASVAFVAARIRPVVGPDPKCVAALIAGLSSPRFETRQQASRQLAAMEAARPALVAALADNPDPEARRRLEDVLRKLDHPSSNPPMLRWLRVVAVLEQIGSAEAREVLRDLANGEPDARFTQSAGAALIRLDKGLNGGFQH